MPLKTLFLNPPSFEGFDGGASSRWPASREIESYWYPVWLCYPAGMLPDSKVVDAPPHRISIEQTVEMAREFELTYPDPRAVRLYMVPFHGEGAPAARRSMPQ